jgi:mannitol-specific phosphotransferase system IIBC component
MNNYNIKYTPDFAYTPINPNIVMNNMIEEKQKNTYDIYVNKFKTAFYGFFLFITLSLPVAYKIIDMIAKIISNNIEIYDLHLEEPTPLGRIVMGLIFFILIFIL